MQSFLTFFLFSFFVLLNSYASHENSMEIKISESRFLVQTLSNDPHVLNQFDLFMADLKKIYSAGEGFIDKDIYNIIEALNFAAEKHSSQVRKNLQLTPYIIHPIGVARFLLTVGNIRDPDIIIGGLLHDTVEDTQTTFEELEQKFGLRIANFVREVTDDKSLPKETRKRLQIEHASEKSAGAAQIKLADKLYNLTDLLHSPPVDWDEGRVDNYFKWAQKVVDGLPWVNAALKKAVDEVIQSYWSNKS